MISKQNSRINMSKKIFLAASALMVNIFLVGCVNQATVPQDYFYRLPVVHPAAPLENKLIKGTLAIAPLMAEGVYRERPLLYVEAERPLELVQYHYRHWSQVPTQLIQDSLLEYFREVNIADKVMRKRSGKPVEFIIQGHLLKFERVVHGSKTEVVVELEIEYQRRTKEGYRSESKTYNRQIISGDSAIHDSIEAFGVA